MCTTGATNFLLERVVEQIILISNTLKLGFCKKTNNILVFNKDFYLKTTFTLKTQYILVSKCGINATRTGRGEMVSFNGDRCPKEFLDILFAIICRYN